MVKFFYWSTEYTIAWFIFPENRVGTVMTVFDCLQAFAMT